MSEARTDAESLALADAFNRLERVSEFDAYLAELEREQGFIVDSIMLSRVESYEDYLERRGIWLGLEQAKRLTAVVVEEAIEIKEAVEGSNVD